MAAEFTALERELQGLRQRDAELARATELLGETVKSLMALMVEHHLLSHPLPNGDVDTELRRRHGQVDAELDRIFAA